MGTTILICTHNRAVLLNRTLHYLNEATPPADCRVQILVVVNACVDETIAMLRDYDRNSRQRGWLALRWVEEPRAGKSNALNRAISLIETPIVALVDDDHRVDKNYLMAICEAIRAHPEASLFCGRILPDWDGREPGWVHDRGTYRIYPLPIPRFDQGEQPHEISLGGAVPGGGNLFLRREVFDRVGGFSAELGPRGHNLAGGEDSDFVLRALNAGERLQYVPAVVQYHYVDLDRLRLYYLIRKSYNRSRANARIWEDRPNRVPVYMWRKLANYLFSGLLSIKPARRRFYLVRIAATLGEIRGVSDRRSPSMTDPGRNEG